MTCLWFRFIAGCCAGSTGVMLQAGWALSGRAQSGMAGTFPHRACGLATGRTLSAGV